MQKKKKKKGRFFQAPTLSYNNKIKIPKAKRTSPVVLNSNLKRASLTIEAALILPLFMLASLMLLSIIDMLQTYVSKEYNLYHSTRQSCILGIAALEQDLIKNDILRKNTIYTVSPKLKGSGFQKVRFENHCCVHLFNGYDYLSGELTSNVETYVYVTKNASVYHRRRSCQYLNVSIRTVLGKDVGKERNLDRSKYYACPKCTKNRTKKERREDVVYITEYGNRYHDSILCRELKRDIRLVPMKEAQGLKPCSSCGGGE